ncbi:MAG TPA: hypothetical protein VFE47_21435 [Tepidisphaeraceae bacterium]|nr:hypothetical protein [Tepidisphaeraceae bacterium]
MIGIPWFFVIAFIVMLVIISLASSKRRQISSSQTRPCKACGAGNPEMAQFCRRCGQKL